MTTRSTVGILVTAFLALGLTACATTRAKLTRVEAERIGLTEAPAGTVVEAELEKEQAHSSGRSTSAYPERRS